MGGRDKLVDFLSFVGPVFQSYSSKVHATITLAIAGYYGHFATLIEPIL
jgi:hypothetical protein